MNRPSPRDILLRTIRRTNQERDSVRNEQRDHPVQNVVPRVSLFDHVLQNFFEGNERMMFSDLNINQTVFASALNIVDSVPLQRRGRPSFVHTHRDKLLFLFVFLVHGTDTTKNMCLPHLNTQSAVLHVLHSTIVKFKDPLVRNLVRFRHERADGMPIVSAVVDCTVMEINGTNLPYGEKDDYYSGKHKRHCLKKR